MGTKAAVGSAQWSAPAVESIERTANGWRVAGDELPDLLSAMVLADLLRSEQGVGGGGRGTPPRAPAGASEAERLRVTVAQLEHALHTRVVIEQAIGVLCERHRIAPREAFDRLRAAARARGRKVLDLSAAVVASCQNPLVALPAELAREGCVVEAG